MVIDFWTADALAVFIFQGYRFDHNMASGTRAVGAFVRGVARSMPRTTLRDHGGAAMGDIDYDRAVEEHEAYIDALGEALGGRDRIFKIDADDELSDCVFIEDAAVLVQDKLLLTRPGAPSRRDEIKGLRSAMSGISAMIVDMQRDADPNATLDGGDVMYTGRHLLVGLSPRTNDAGAAFLKHTFDNVDVVVIPQVGDSSLHLKCALTHIDERNCVVSSKPDALATAQAVNEAVKVQSPTSPEPYAFHSAGLDEIFANVVRVNETLLVPSGPSNDAMKCYSHILAAGIGIESIVQVPWREFAKADGSLTCRSVLMRE